MQGTGSLAILAAVVAAVEGETMHNLAFWRLWRRLHSPTAPSFSMGRAVVWRRVGGSGGGSASFDDYSTALRLIHHEKYAEAIPHLEMALADKPHDADILNYLGYTHRMMGDSPIAGFLQARAGDRSRSQGRPRISRRALSRR